MHVQTQVYDLVYLWLKRKKTNTFLLVLRQKFTGLTITLDI